MTKKEAKTWTPMSKQLFNIEPLRHLLQQPSDNPNVSIMRIMQSRDGGTMLIWRKIYSD